MNIEHIVKELAKQLKTAPRYAGQVFEVSEIEDLPNVSYNLTITLTRVGDPDMHQLLAQAEAE